MTCSIAVAAEIPLVNGTHWVKSTEEVKKAYLVGVSNIIQLEMAYQADKPVPAESQLLASGRQRDDGADLEQRARDRGQMVCAHILISCSVR